MEIHPGLNCQTTEDLERDLEIVTRVSPPGGWIHLDVADAKFTFHKTWNEPESWPKFKSKLDLEVHLMVEEPEREVLRWVAAGAKRIIVHYEAIVDNRYRQPARRPDEVIATILERCAGKNIEVFLGVNPETPAETIKPYLGRFAGALVLAVHPGLSGQKFQKPMLEKIIFLRHVHPNVIIEVDGGVNPEIAPQVRSAGAHIAVATSYISRAVDPKKAYEELKNI